LIILLEYSLWKGLEQITTVLGPEGYGQLSEEGHSVYNLTTFGLYSGYRSVVQDLCINRSGQKEGYYKNED
jgi:hypothetical protein